MSESALPSSAATAARDDNLSIYRTSRGTQSKLCPNLPLTLLVEVTSKCNLTCKICNIHHGTGSGLTMADRLLEKTFEFAEAAAVVYPFGLGEALLYPKLMEVIGRYKSFGPSVGLISNGMLLNKETAEGLIREGLDSLVISIDAADPVLFAELRRGGDLERISENIRTLNRLKTAANAGNPLLSMNVVAQARNFSQLPSIVQLAERLAFSSVAIGPITVHQHIPEIQNDGLKSGMPRWREILELCKEEADSKGIGIDMRRLYFVMEEAAPEEVYRETMPCPEPFRFMGVRANGDVFPCCNWDVDQPIARVSLTGESPESDLREAWNHPNWQVLREEVISGEYPAQCRKCMENFTRPLHDEYLS